MRAILVKDGCLVALNGKEKKPAGIKDEIFAENDELAIACIYLALNKVVLFNVSEETTAKGLWDKLQNLYEGNSLTNKIFLRI